MPVEIQPQTARWLQSLLLISPPHLLTHGTLSLTYNDELYLKNGYLIAQILKSVLKSSGGTVDGLMRVRKIAYITSNENWRIL